MFLLCYFGALPCPRYAGDARRVDAAPCFAMFCRCLLLPADADAAAFDGFSAARDVDASFACYEDAAC